MFQSLVSNQQLVLSVYIVLFSPTFCCLFELWLSAGSINSILVFYLEFSFCFDFSYFFPVIIFQIFVFCVFIHFVFLFFGLPGVSFCVLFRVNLCLVIFLCYFVSTLILSLVQLVDQLDPEHLFLVLFCFLLP